MKHKIAKAGLSWLMTQTLTAHCNGLWYLILTRVWLSTMNTWIECVDFQELLLTGLEKPLFKFSVVSLHCVFICDWGGEEKQKQKQRDSVIKDDKAAELTGGAAVMRLHTN